MATRRTHMVRVFSEDSKDDYFDIEVLDAISFKIDGGKEVVINMPPDKVAPFIVDNTDANEAKSPANPTRRSHVEKLTGDDGVSTLYVEVFDAAAYRDQNNDEWIITAPKSSPYDVTDGSGGGSGATRRCHDEKISAADPADHNPTSDFVTVQRSDMLAFRSVHGKEMIIKMPSADDGSLPRADTFISNMPNNTYDPTSEDDSQAPPENKDQHFYVKFKSGGVSPLLGSTKIKQGPFWWIRKVKKGGGLVLLDCSYIGRNTGSPPALGEPMILSHAPWNAPPMDIFSGDIKFPSNAKASVINPVTPEMRASLDQWSVGDSGVYRQPSKATSDGGAGLFSTYSPSSDAENAFLFNKPEIGLPTKDNLHTMTWYGLTYGDIWGIFTSKADAQASADKNNARIAAGNAAAPSESHPVQPDYFVVTLESSDPKNIFSQYGQEVVALNMGKAKTTRGPTGDPVFTFQITTPDMSGNDQPSSWGISACAFDSSVKDFPLDAINNPTFAPMGGGDQTNVDPVTGRLLNPKTGKFASGVVLDVGDKTARTLVFTVNTKTLEITVSG